MRNPRVIVALVSFSVMVLSFGAFLVWRYGPVGFSNSHVSAQLRFDTDASPKLNQPYVVRVMAVTERQSINSAGVYLRFDPQKLRVAEIDTLLSFCQFYPEKKFDNQLGTVSLACGAPHPGVRGEIELLRITFLPLVESSSQLLVESQSVLLASDGKGTNLLTEYPILEVSPGVSF